MGKLLLRSTFACMLHSARNSNSHVVSINNIALMQWLKLKLCNWPTSAITLQWSVTNSSLLVTYMLHTGSGKSLNAAASLGVYISGAATALRCHMVLLLPVSSCYGEIYKSLFARFALFSNYVMLAVSS